MDKQINDPVLKSKQYLVRALLVAGYDLYFHDKRTVPTFEDGLWSLVPAGETPAKFVVAARELYQLLDGVVENSSIMWQLITPEVDDELPDAHIDEFGDINNEEVVKIQLAYLQGFHNASKFPALVPEVLEPGALVIRAIVKQEETKFNHYCDIIKD